MELEAHDATGGHVLPPDYNVAPTKEVYAVLVRRGERQLRVLRWGLVPSWASDAAGGARRINARLETIAERPAFRSAFARRRCLIPADGWYEWAPSEDRTARQPYFITPADGSLLAFAGLYEVRDGELTCAIITSASTGRLREVHDRMPVTLPRTLWRSWLDPAAPDPAVLLAPDDDLLGGLELRPVGRAVGNVDNNGPALVAPVVPQPAQTLF